MRDKSLFSIPILIAGAMLLVAAGYFLIVGNASSGNSQLQIGFVDLQSPTKLESMSANRLKMKIHNPTSTVARIVGNNAC